VHSIQAQQAQIGGANAVAPAPSEVETEMNRLGNALSLLDNAAAHLAGRLRPVSREPGPVAAAPSAREVMTSPLSASLQSAREQVDQVTARINVSIELLAI